MEPLVLPTDDEMRARLQQTASYTSGSTGGATWIGSTSGRTHASVALSTIAMDEDPGVQAGIFTYDVHPVRGFPGASLL